MIEFTVPFIISQILMVFAMILDFLSFQYKKRETTIILFIASAALISAHYFLLNKITAGAIVFMTVVRLSVCYFKTDKKYMYLFIVLNTIILYFTYSELLDLLIYVGIIIVTIGNFQKSPKLMRQIMMVGTSLVVLYNIIILTPVGILTECVFLGSNIISYFRFYHGKESKEKITS